MLCKVDGLTKMLSNNFLSSTRHLAKEWKDVLMENLFINIVSWRSLKDKLFTKMFSLITLIKNINLNSRNCAFPVCHLSNSQWQLKSKEKRKTLLEIFWPANLLLLIKILKKERKVVTFILNTTLIWREIIGTWL